MKVKIHSGKLLDSAELITIAVFEDEKDNALLKKLKLSNNYKKILKGKSFKAKLCETRLLDKQNKSYFGLVGLGKKKEFSLEKLRRAVSAVHKKAKLLGAKSYFFPLEYLGLADEEMVFAAAESALLTNYKFDTYKNNNKDYREVETVFLCCHSKKNFTTVIRKAELYANNVCYCRDLVNHPPNVLGPEYLAREAKKLRSKGVRVTVLGKRELVKGKFNGILAVSSGSAKEPKLIILDYNSKAKKSVALVGKGITFDAGGLNLKPGGYINTMKSDMGGAAAVLSSVKAAAELKLNKRVIGIIPTCENMLGANAYRPDDVLKMYSGKTVEIGNTDAEGRIILADALAYTDKKIKPNEIIDLATLTGACVVALGHWCSGLLTKNERMAKKLEKAGVDSGDLVWRLPLWEDHQSLIDSDIADIRNISHVREAGTIEAAVFLSNFVKNKNWAHLDIAGTAYLKEAFHYQPKNGTGAGVRVVLKYLES